MYTQCLVYTQYTQVPTGNGFSQLLMTTLNYSGPWAYRLKKRACSCTPINKRCLKIVTVSKVSIVAKPAKVTKYSINYNHI